MEFDRDHLGGHIRSQYDEEMEAIRGKVLTMGGLVEEQIREAMLALRDGDGELGEKVVTDDYRVNSMEVEIDEDCQHILALRQPAAGDLRMVIAIIKTITDLERIGDEAEKIGRMASRLAASGRPGRGAGLQHLGTLVLQMVHDALDAFARLDVKSALNVVRRDNVVDSEYDTILRTYMTYMMEDPRQISQVMDMIWCARSLERIGDHAKNTCEYIVFLVKGKDVRHTSIEKMEEQARGSAGA